MCCFDVLFIVLICCVGLHCVRGMPASRGQGTAGTMVWCQELQSSSSAAVIRQTKLAETGWTDKTGRNWLDRQNWQKLVGQIKLEGP
jgi:hypothetical protein